MEPINVLVLTTDSKLKVGSNFDVLERMNFSVTYSDSINDAIINLGHINFSIILVIEQDHHIISKIIKGMKLSGSKVPFLVSAPLGLPSNQTIEGLINFKKISYPCSVKEINNILTNMKSLKDSVRSRYKFLIVDDLANNRELVKEILSGTGVILDEAPNGKEALRKIFENNYDIIFLDYKMPDLNGAQVLKGIRTKFSRKKLPVIITSAENKLEVVHRLIYLGAQDYIIKPIERDNFYKKIMKFLS